MYVRRYVTQTDHKLLERVYYPDKMTPPMAAARIQRLALILSAYNYAIRFKKETLNANADALSRLPLQKIPSSTPVSGETVLLVELLETTPIMAEQVSTWTQRSPILA